MGREMPHKNDMFEDECKDICMLHMKTILKLETSPFICSLIWQNPNVRSGGDTVPVSRLSRWI